jgi:AraC-like DNA-binding protein
MDFSVFKSVRSKMVLYFSLVLSLSTMVTGGACYFFFSRNYRGSMEHQNDLQLGALSGQIDQQVYRHARQQFIEMTVNTVLYQYLNSLFKDPVSQRNVKIFNAVRELQSLVTFSGGIVDSVDIYFPESRISISSMAGFNDFASGIIKEDLYLWEAVLEDRNRIEQNYYWWDLRQISSYQNVKMVHFGFVPLPGADPRGIIAISIDPSVFASWLSVLETKDTQFFLINSELSSIYGSVTELAALLSEEELSRIAGSKYDGLVHHAASTDANTIVSWIRSAESPTVLLSAVSTSSFRQGMDEIMVFILVIGIVVIVAGLAVSGVFSLRLYRPLKQLVASVGQLPGWNSRQNEYSYLNQAIDMLHRMAAEYGKAFEDYLETIARDLSGALNARSLDWVCRVLDYFQKHCAGLEKNSDYCRREMEVLLDVFTRYLSKQGIEKILNIDDLKTESCESIEVFCERMRGAAGEAFDAMASQNNQRTQLLSKILIYIKANLSKPISLESVADHCGISAGYVGKIIKEETGENWVDYLNKERLEISIALLNDSSVKIEEIASHAGFNSAAYYIKRFKQRYGMTPNAYRNQKKTSDL